MTGNLSKETEREPEWGSSERKLEIGPKELRES